MQKLMKASILLCLLVFFGSVPISLIAESAKSETTDDILQYISPTQVSLPELEKTEWRGLAPDIIHALKVADRMIR